MAFVLYIFAYLIHCKPLSIENKKFFHELSFNKFILYKQIQSRFQIIYFSVFTPSIFQGKVHTFYFFAKFFEPKLLGALFSSELSEFI